MPATTTAYAKNIIRRALREVVDRSPSKRDIILLWEFFESSCAYCGTHLLRENKEGHVDHLVAASKGGSNHISNRVLACANCNEKEKLDQPWEQFLRRKNFDRKTFSRRQSKILEWTARSKKRQEDELMEAAEAAAARVAAYFDEEVLRLRQAASERFGIS
jgi:CRISPR/Cas system Type II protein with McrA/HNH and RuvC-like nuclease domain